MKNYLAKSPQELRKVISDIRNVALSKNLKVYLVGGFVRDLILGVNNLDLDIVVEGEGIDFARHYAKVLGVKFISHKHFGTATVYIKPHLKVDFSTARNESYPKPAHLPIVQPGLLKDDLSRRDFTINAMAIYLSNNKLIDLFSGLRDLKDKKIRVLHDLSFIDDPTRILRAIRFEQRFNFRIEPRTLRLLKDASRLKMLNRVQPHRIRDDLILILKEKNPIKEIKRIEGLLGFDFIHLKLRINAKIYALLKAIEKEVKAFSKDYPKRRDLDIWLVFLIGLFDGLNKQDIKGVCSKFGLRRGEEIRILSYKKSNNIVKALSKADIKPSSIFKLLEPLSYETIICLKAKYNNSFFNTNSSNFLSIYNGMRIFVAGGDLHKLGVVPGPRYQQIFIQVLAAKLNGLVSTKEEELNLIRKLLNKRS